MFQDFWQAHYFKFYSLLIGYAFGHIQTSYLLGKTFKKIDIREHGTGNPGMSNSLSVMGVRYAFIILVIDVLKSFGAYTVCSILFNGVGASVGESFVFGDGSNGILPGMYGSFGAILGHAFPVYMRFKGGKGMACILGLILALDVLMTGLMILIALLTIIITRFFSPAAIITLFTLPISIAIFFRNDPHGIEAVFVAVFIGCVLMVKHIDNIKRIKNGTESRIGRKAKQPPG